MTTATATSQTEHNHILLESGTNELEVLVFHLSGQSYGVNVAKVREVILPLHITVSPNQPPAVIGMFNLRGVIHSLINLHKFLDIPHENPEHTDQKVLVTEFNGIRAAFQVDGVDQIHRVSWAKMRHVPDSLTSDHMAVTGILEIKDQMILMLDFESIVDHILVQEDLRIESVDNTLGVNRENVRLVLAEDSVFMRTIIENLLQHSGYTNVTTYPDGQQALRGMQQNLKNGQPVPDVLISDIEMPQMDGLTLTRHIKEHPELRSMRVALFSSLISQDTRHKGERVGADAQLTKPQLANLVGILDSWAGVSS